MPMTVASRSAPERLRKAESHPSKKGSPSGLPFSAITCGVLELASRQRVDPTTRSEVEPECELEHPRGLRGEREEEVRVSGDSPACATINATVGVAEVDVVEDVKRLRAELAFDSFRDLEVLESRKVRVPQFRAAKCVPLHLPEAGAGARTLPGAASATVSGQLVRWDRVAVLIQFIWTT